jgi:dihydrodipicolinate synthase/N-acetylneuraminate lyase
MTIEDYRASVVAVPPIALSDDLQVAREANAGLVRHIEKGGVRTLLYGGNANLYNFDLGRYADALAMMDDAASPSINIITSVGPDFGKLSDQLPVVERSAVRNVMLLPMTFPVDAGGLLRGIRFAADRLGFGVILYIKRENYLSPDLLAELAADGSVAFVKYAVERKEPSDDAYLDAILSAIGRDIVASGMGEAPIADHIGKRGLATFTSGAVCIAPAASNRLLALYREGRLEEAQQAAEPFLAFERLRARFGGIQVLHDAVTASGIAPMGPQLPMVSGIPAAARKELKLATDKLIDADRIAVLRT